MIKVTLDTNCIIDLEQHRPSEIYIKEFIQMNMEGKIQLSIPAISASEKQKDGSYIKNFSTFKDIIHSVGLDNVELLKPVGYYGITFMDWCIYSGDKLKELEISIHNILFPGIDYAYADYCKNNGLESKTDEIKYKWRNAKCDVLAIWCHIYYNHDYFITNDSNFHKTTKKPALIKLGAKNIEKPENIKCITIHST